ncbi:hypothetical protein BC835DRAFT_1097868 [Cytidiella melzeri]|nr:hypothetical protein BC835DRAFT_1097868 [Cytidiella melzeri]
MFKPSGKAAVWPSCPAATTTDNGGPCMATCSGQYDSGVTTGEPRNGLVPMILWPTGSMQGGDCMTATDKGIYQSVLHESKADRNHDHLYPPCLSRSLQSAAGFFDDFPDATSQRDQPTYTVRVTPPSILSPPPSPAPNMNYPTIGQQYHPTQEDETYVTSCDFLYPFVDLQLASKESWVLHYGPDTPYTAFSGEEGRPSTGCSSMSTPQLSASSAREASCSPLSTYDETPSPMDESINDSAIAGTGVYAAPTAAMHSWEYPAAHDTLYGTATQNSVTYSGYPTPLAQYWDYQGAALQGYPQSSLAPTWHQASCSAQIPGTELFPYWSQSSEYAQPLEMVVEPSLFASDVQAPQAAVITPTVTTELQHPRPQRNYVNTTWQNEEFDAEQFLAGLSRPFSPSSTTLVQSLVAESDGYEVVYPDYGTGNEVEANWETGGIANPCHIDQVGLDAYSGPTAAPADIEIGQGIGLGSSTRTLGSNSILYKSVALPLRCLDESDFLLAPIPAEPHEFATTFT